MAASMYYFVWEPDQLCLILCDTKDCNLPGSSVQGSFQQENWSMLTFPPPGDLPEPGMEPKSPVSCIGRQILYQWPTWEAQCTTLLRHLNVSGRKTYFIKMIAWWYINFFTLCLQCQLCWLCYYHNFSLLITMLVYAKQITYSATLIILN